MSAFTRNNGGRSLTFAELVGTYRDSRGQNATVHVVREATLSKDLSSTEHRRLRGVRVALDTDRNIEHRNDPVDLDYDGACRLWAFLGVAIEAIKTDRELDR